jgi:hypothetical protein
MAMAAIFSVCFLLFGSLSKSNLIFKKDKEDERISLSLLSSFLLEVWVQKLPVHARVVTDG